MHNGWYKDVTRVNPALEEEHCVPTETHTLLEGRSVAVTVVDRLLWLREHTASDTSRLSTICIVPRRSGGQIFGLRASLDANDGGSPRPCSRGETAVTLRVPHLCAQRLN